MYKSVLFLAFFCFHLFSNGQSVKTVTSNDNALLDAGNLWSVLEYDEFFSPPDHLDPTLKTTWIKVGNDTTINSVKYKKMLFATDEHHENWEIGNFLREDNGKVFRYEENEDERLLYDFNMEVGDSIYYSTGYGEYITKVDSIKDTLMYDATYKQYYLSVSTYSGSSRMTIPERWIEGIGSKWGLNRKFHEFATGNYTEYSLNCFHKDGVQLYQSPEYRMCYYDQILCDDPLLDSRNIWSVLEYDERYSADHLHATLETKWIKVGNDTIINSKKYRKMLCSFDENHENWELDNFLREVDGRVYRYEENEDERLLYDFNMEVGDSIYYPNGSSNIITKVDSIKDTLLFKTTHKLYYLSTYQYSGSSLMVIPEKWIGNVGSTWGVNRKWFEFRMGTHPVYSLNCFHKKEDLLYQSPEYSKCYYNEITMGNEEIKRIIDVEISPNPSRGKLTISTTEPLNDCRLEVFDLTGRLIKSQLVQHSTYTVVNLAGEKPGIYILKLENNDYYSVKKFVLAN